MHFGLVDLLSSSDAPDEAAILPEDEPAPHVDPGSKQFQLVLRRKRQNALLMAMLRAQGYDDLAQMAAVRQQGDRSVY